ncbi:flagellar hook-associated protein FlgK [Halomonas sp. HP20-15]|uniref:flagellar hook-associated protein FlgK n=1 Tax=Halomonas sp. HP20-15 TaxID=3085901 RepID=UPI00298257AF|nr:flagellar hook-associated protein FlgK [Halomonas sp. HP20-15]MDW5375311.1 flagellar hook-associated protein FlgK [Halomonas sp. HP20-15]
MSLFSTGLSGLSAAQVALQTTSTNISNVYTPGYNRQITQLGETSPSGGGVQVNDIERQFNQYIASQLNEATSRSSALQAYDTQVSQLDNLLADGEAGLAPLMQNFFSSLEDLSGAPSDPAARQGLIGSADTLTAQFRAFDSYLDDMQSGINGQIRDEVTQINNTTDQLAKLNRQISLTQAKTGDIPNNLLNQRDHLVADLSERMDVKLSIQDGGTYNLTMANGQPLVAGNRSYSLEAVASSSDPTRTVVAYNDPGGSQIELGESTFEGGTLGGLMTFRSETLDKTQSQVGQMALALAEGFNEQHRAGQDLNGAQGQDFFAIGSPSVFSNEKNASDASFSAEFSDFSAVTTSDYRIKYESGDFVVSRAGSKQPLDPQPAVETDADGNKTLSFDGMTLTLDESAGAIAEGDTFLIQPTKNLAGQLENVIHDTSKIAASAHVKVTPSLQTGSTLAASSVKVEEGFALPASDIVMTVSNADNAAGTFTLSHDAPTGSEVLVNGEVPADPANVQLSTGDTLSINGVSMTFSGKPIDGDTLTLSSDPSSGDNRNALALQNLQHGGLVEGKASLSEAYASLVSDVGNRTNVVQANLSAQSVLTEQLTAVQQSESGVNLDEEAANLIRFQQFYQANAKVIQTGSTLLDTILGIR